jgi:hypothetical protein
MNTHSFIASAVALSIGFVGGSRYAAGQDQPDSTKRDVPRWTTGSINVQIGSARLGLTELNESRTANGRPAFSENVSTFGMSGQVRFGRLLLGGGGETALPQRELSPGWISKISFGSMTLDAGMALIDRPRIRVYPTISVGIRKTKMQMERIGDFTYDDGMQDPARGVSLSSRSALAGAGIVVETYVSSRLTGEFSIGLRTGVMSPVGNPATSAGERSVSGTPRETSGRYLRLSIGKPIGRRRDAMSALSSALLSLFTS